VNTKTSSLPTWQFVWIFLSSKQMLFWNIYNRVSQEEMPIFWKVIVSAILNKRVYMYMYPIPNVFRERAISLYSCKVVDKEILHIVSNTDIYCSIDIVGTVYPVHYTFENSTINFNAPCNLCVYMACCSSECILTFLCIGDNIHYEIEQFVSCIHLCSVHCTLMQPHKQKCNWAQYGGSEGQYWVPKPNSCTVKYLNLGNRSQ